VSAVGQQFRRGVQRRAVALVGAHAVDRGAQRERDPQPAGLGQGLRGAPAQDGEAQRRVGDGGGEDPVFDQAEPLPRLAEADR
jgi:hypothetical protein